MKESNSSASRWISDVSTLMVILIGVLTLVGWRFDISYFREVHPAFPNMAPNLALAFTFSGIALWFLRKPEINFAQRWIARASYVIVFIIGLFTITEYVLVLDERTFPSAVKFDEMLFRFIPLEVVEKYPGRPAFNAGIGLFLSACALFSLESPRTGKNFAQLFGLMVGFLSFIVLSGYLFSAATFVSIPTTRTFRGGEMAFHAALAFLCFSIGLLASRPHEGFMKLITSESIGGVAARHMLTAVLLGPVMLAAFAAVGSRLGLFDMSTRVSILTSLSVTLFGIWSFWTVRTLNILEADRNVREREREELLVREKTAREESDRAVRLRDDMIDVISHELKNPLMALSSGIALIQRIIPKDDPKLRVALTTLNRLNSSIPRINRMVSDLMDVTRMEAGKFRIEPQAHDFSKIADDALKIFEASAYMKSVRLSADIPESLPYVFCDYDRIIQVLSNLLDNGIKFTDAGGSVIISARQPGEQIEVEVADTGRGMPEEYFGHIFDRFWQAKDTAYKGIGLGLTITKGIVEAHGGRIWVKSKEGQGTSFFFTLPTSEVQIERQREIA